MQTIKIIVKTKAGKSEVLGFDSGRDAYRVAVKSAAEKGAANLEAVKLLSKHFKTRVKIISGLKSGKKLVKIMQ